MIIGFNTDIEHDGTVYHVQTEDKGLETPLILSLIYVGGAILASKRAFYHDIIAAGFDAGLLAERLQRQHKLICAAISAGRIEDLKRMSQREADVRDASHDSTAVTPTASVQDNSAVATDDLNSQPPPVPIPVEEPSVETLTPVRVESSQASTKTHREVFASEPIPVELEDELHLSLLEEKDFRAGDIVTLRVMVMRGAFGAKEVVWGAVVTVKVLGTEFRPLILTSKTDVDGIAVVHVWLPRFTSGRAAILIRATSDGCSAELRRVIHQS